MGHDQAWLEFDGHLRCNWPSKMCVYSASRKISSPVARATIGGIERGLPRMELAFLRRTCMACDRLTGAIPKLNDQLEPLAAIYPKRCHAFAITAIIKSQYPTRDFASACLRERSEKVHSVTRHEVELESSG